MSNKDLSGMDSEKLHALVESYQESTKKRIRKDRNTKIIGSLAITTLSVALGYLALNYKNDVSELNSRIETTNSNHNFVIQENAELKERIQHLDGLAELKDEAYSGLEDQIKFLEENTLAIGGAARDYFSMIRAGEISYSDLSSINSFAPEVWEKEIRHKIEEHNLENYNLIFDWMDYPVQNTEMSYVSAPYGWGDLNGIKRFHNGSDIVSPYDKEVTAVADGRVVVVNFEEQYPYETYGESVIIEHYDDHLRPRQTPRALYAHLETTNLRPGDLVEKGDVVGIIGNTGRSTGPHLHFEIYMKNMDRAGWRSTNPFSNSTYGPSY